MLPEGSLHDSWVSPLCFLSVTCMFLECHLYVSWVSPVCLLCTDQNPMIQIYNKPSTTEWYWFLQNNATSYRSTHIRTDPLRFGQIHKESHILTPIHKDTQIIIVPCNFVQIHIDPYKSTQIRTGPHRFPQIHLDSNRSTHISSYYHRFIKTH